MDNETKSPACALAYVTFPDDSICRKAALEVEQKHLAAGANIVGPIFSVYHWEGEIRQREEWLLFAQIRLENFEAFRNAITNLHPDINPCVIALPILAGHGPFLAWIAENCQLERACPSP